MIQIMIISMLSQDADGLKAKALERKTISRKRIMRTFAGLLTHFTDWSAHKVINAKIKVTCPQGRTSIAGYID